MSPLQSEGRTALVTDQSEAEAAVERLTAFAGWCENPRGDDDEAFSDYTNGNCASDLRLLLAERRGLVEVLEPFAGLNIHESDTVVVLLSGIPVESISADSFRRARSALQGKGGDRD